MKPSTKQLTVNLPIALTFATEDEIGQLAASINTIVAGKSRIKCESVGKLNSQYIGIFYLQRDKDFSELRQSFVDLIEQEEIQPLITASNALNDLII